MLDESNPPDKGAADRHVAQAPALHGVPQLRAHTLSPFTGGPTLFRHKRGRQYGCVSNRPVSTHTGTNAPAQA